MAQPGPAELAVMLSQLNASQLNGHRNTTASRPPTPTEAMATYFVAARLVELQLELVDRGECDDAELAVTRDVLVSTHRMLVDALDGPEPAAPRRPALRMVHGMSRRRPRGRR